MPSLAWPAPAKLNLFLHITGRRADGYHELQTVFQFLDYGDELRFTVRDDGVIRALHNLPGVASEQDLTVRAARLLKENTGTSLGADIELAKRLPIGGGLGGGSSDAATTLVALNHLWKLGLSVDELAKLGLRLGADVPVFIHGRAAWAEGVGERLTPMQLEEPWYVVIAPPCRVSTGEIFASPDLTRDAKPITIRGFLAGKGGNDCEVLVCQRYPEVAQALRWLGGHASARMTGTGSCVFAAFPDEMSARRVAGQFIAERPDGGQAFVAQGLNLSPLHRLIHSKIRK
ncbi:MAG: 4-(cytidine 5'-diphospho)-2-C-methyl-D-erythritol kinase [Gammaproteobacteria bacterium]|nr:4-(cytidine 5'-diphospho)-2-C-methyl-D-erythritol kinase [Gammaproteobacteria bacterium]